MVKEDSCETTEQLVIRRKLYRVISDQVSTSDSVEGTGILMPSRTFWTAQRWLMKRKRDLRNVMAYGAALKSLRSAFQTEPNYPQARLLIWGSKRSGKTSLMYYWKLGAFLPTVIASHA